MVLVKIDCAAFARTPRTIETDHSPVGRLHLANARGDGTRKRVDAEAIPVWVFDRLVVVIQVLGHGRISARRSDD